MIEQTQRVVASAPGKVILFGEQCVVLGRIAIATALDLRTFVTVETCPSSNTVEIQIPDLSTEPRSFTLEQLKYDGSLPSIAEPSLDNELLAFIESITPSADRGIVALLFILLGISQKKYKHKHHFSLQALRSNNPVFTYKAIIWTKDPYKVGVSTRRGIRIICSLQC